MSKFKRVIHSWGEEWIIGEGARVARVYASAKKITVDLSQVRDETWDRFAKVQAKYPGRTRIELSPDADVEAIIRFWMEPDDAPAPAPAPTPVPKSTPAPKPAPTPASAHTLVYGFKGTRRWTKVGSTFEPEQTSSNLGPWRASKSSDGAAVQHWLVKEGYRKVWYKSGKGPTAQYEEYWAHELIVGNSPEHLHVPMEMLAELLNRQESTEQFARRVCGVHTGKE